MAEDERTKRNNDLKIKKKDYTGYDDDEFEEGRVGQKRSVLAKYDEELQGPQDTVGYLRFIDALTLTPSQGVPSW